MKHSKLTALIAACALTLSLCGCAEKEKSKTGAPKESPSVVSSADGSSATASAVSKPARSEVSSASSSASSAASERAGDTAKAKQLLEALNQIDKMGAGSLATDSAKTIQKGQAVYKKVTDSKYPDTKSIKEYLTDNMTEKMISSRYSALLGTDTPRFIDSSGELYQLDSAKSGGFAFLDEAPKISDITDTGFAVSARYDDFGAPVTMTIKAVLEEGKWKIDSFHIA